MPDRPSLFLYSVNLYMKYVIQENYIGQHFVWCSEYFDPLSLGINEPGRRIPPSSSPASLYRRYKEDVEGGDTHSIMINNQKTSLTNRAAEWFQKGKISGNDFVEIVFYMENNLRDWRPVIYLIRRDLVQARLDPVPPEERAGSGMEYRISDLTRDEFDILEV